jgi:hypothetical protein
MKLKCPPIDAELITYLETIYPDQVPNLDDTDRKVWFKVGGASVVRHLKDQHKKQQNNILET